MCKKNRDELALYLKENDIQTNIYYKWSLSDQKGYKNSFKNVKNYKNTEYLSKSIIALPIYPEINESTINKVSEYINKYFRTLN